MLTATDILDLARRTESDRVERTISETNTNKAREAICAFSNDLPDNRLPGVYLVGVENDGTVRGVTAQGDQLDRLLQTLVGLRSDGQIDPMPVMHVYPVEVGAGVTVVVIEVQPSDAPPVRARGVTWIRCGPRRDIASREEEGRLTEKRVARARTYDLSPARGTTVSDLFAEQITEEYIPRAVSAESLRANQRTLLERLASLRFLDPRTGTPTVGALLMFGVDPLSVVPGAYIQFVRYAGTELSDPVQDNKTFTGNLRTQMTQLDALLPGQIRVSRAAADGLRHEDAPDYPIPALRELVLNAVMHRSYDGSNAPVRITWFSDRLEIQSPGGLYGQVNPANFGRITDYRNPLVSEALKVLGYVDKFGAGIARAQAALAKNGNPPALFAFEPQNVLVTVRARQ